MGEWGEFFVAQAGAAAVLAGLVFVGVSINLRTVLGVYGLTGRAAEALVLLGAVLFASSLLLMPWQGARVAGVEVLAVGLADWAAIVYIHAAYRRKRRHADVDTGLAPEQEAAYFRRRVVMGQAATLLFLASGVVLVGWGLVGLYPLAAGILLSYLVAMGNAWVLLIEIQR